MLRGNTLELITQLDNTIMVLVERKEILVGWTGDQGRSLIVLTEKRKKKTFRGVINKDCIVWLVAVLRHLAREGGLGSQQDDVSRWRDHLGTVLVSSCVKREISLVLHNGKKPSFACLPERMVVVGSRGEKPCLL